VQNIVFADTWESFFQRFGLTTLEAFYQLSTKYKPRQMATKKSVVVNFSLGKEGEEKEFFIKWYLRVQFKNKLSVWRKFGKHYSQSRAEWETAQDLTQAGIPTYQPVCYGEEMGRFFEKRSFLVTRKIPRLSLAEYIQKNWSAMTEAQRENLFTCLAAFIRSMHDKGIHFPDLYAKHIFLEPMDSGDYQFTLIDLQRIARHKSGRNRTIIKDLGALYWSLPVQIVDDHYRYLFAKLYTGNDDPESIDKLVHQIQKRSRHIGHLRRPHQ